MKSSGVLSVSFNQDFGCFACGTDNGFRVFNTDPLKQNQQKKLGGGISVVEMLFRCNYVALVGGGNTPAFPTNVVVIWDVVNSKEVVRLEMSDDVKAVRLRRDRIVVVLETTLHVFSFTDNPRKLHVFDSSRNPRGICCLCPSSDNSLLAFPSPSSHSFVTCINLGDPDAPPKNVAAHTRPLSAIALNATGTQLATASEKGTIIRIFDTHTLTLLRELRRGTNPAIIYCLNFSPDSTMLCVSSNRSTIHLFALNDTKKKRTSLRRLSLSGEVSFSRFQLPFSVKKNDMCICAFGLQPDCVIAVSSDGSYCKFNFERSRGECTRQTCSLYLELTE